MDFRSLGSPSVLRHKRPPLQVYRCPMTPSRDISRLIEIMAQLRTPVTGCPWDLEQNFATIAPYTIEEAYEVADAIARGDFDDLSDELGDLLLQVVYPRPHGGGGKGVCLRRCGRGDHEEDDPPASACVRRQGRQYRRRRRQKPWERIKAEEKAERAARRPQQQTHNIAALEREGRPARADARAWNCSARPPPSASTGTTRARC